MPPSPARRRTRRPDSTRTSATGRSRRRSRRSAARYFAELDLGWTQDGDPAKTVSAHLVLTDSFTGDRLAAGISDFRLGGPPARSAIFNAEQVEGDLVGFDGSARLRIESSPCPGGGARVNVFFDDELILSRVGVMEPDRLEIHVVRQLNQTFGTVSYDRVSFGPFTPCPGDLDRDDAVGFSDLLRILAAWGPCGAGQNCIEDIDCDGNVGFSDILLALGAWGPC